MLRPARLGRHSVFAGSSIPHKLDAFGEPINITFPVSPGPVFFSWLEVFRSFSSLVLAASAHCSSLVATARRNSVLYSLACFLRRVSNFLIRSQTLESLWLCEGKNNRLIFYAKRITDIRRVISVGVVESFRGSRERRNPP